MVMVDKVTDNEFSLICLIFLSPEIYFENYSRVHLYRTAS